MPTPAKPTLPYALASLLVPVALILVGVAVWKVGATLPLMGATVLASLFALGMGLSWRDIQEGLFAAVSRVLVAYFILMLVAMLVGIWILSGTIPVLLDWGLRFIAPGSFLASTFLLCVVASTATGTSFGTLGTLGVALLGVGQALGYPAPVVVGAVVSGAYFGDKMSPVSDSTNIAATVCEVELFPHIVSMLWTTLPAAVFAGGMYLAMGLWHGHGALPGHLEAIHGTLAGRFHLSPLAALPPVLIVILAYRRMPALPLLVLGIVAGILAAVALQGARHPEVLKVLLEGYRAQTGSRAVDDLLSRGGLASIQGVGTLLLCGVAFGGVLERMGTLEVLVEALLRRVRSIPALVGAVLASGYLALLGTGSQMVGVILPGRAFLPAFRARGLDPRILSRTCEDGATLGCPLVPWSVHAIFIGSVLGVGALEYAPYAFLNWLVPCFSMALAHFRLGLWDGKGRPLSRRKRRAPAPDGPGQRETEPVPHL